MKTLEGKFAIPISVGIIFIAIVGLVYFSPQSIDYRRQMAESRQASQITNGN